MTALETHYRRLIRLFPAGHRYRYSEEMLGTLMEGAGARQRYPRLGEAADLVRNAVWLRLFRRDPMRGRDPRWAAAAWMFGLLAAMFLTVEAVATPAAEVVLAWRTGSPAIAFHATQWFFALAGGWLVVTLMALAGWRIPAFILAWMTALADLVWHLMMYRSFPLGLPGYWPTIVLSFSAAICLSLRKPAKRPVPLLGIAIAMSAYTASFVADSLIAHIQVVDGGQTITLWGEGFTPRPGVEPTGIVPVIVSLLLVAVLVRMLAKAEVGIRRRLYAIAAPSVLTYFLYNGGFRAFGGSGVLYVYGGMTLNLAQWLILLLLPLVAFAFGVIAVHRNDDQDELIELGRAARLSAVPTGEPTGESN